MIKYYKKKCISAKNSDLSWALHSLDCLEANIFKTTFFCQVFAYFTPLLATENDIVRLLSEMTLGSSFLSAQKSPASIWRNIFSRPKRNCIFANKYFFFSHLPFFLWTATNYCSGKKTREWKNTKKYLALPIFIWNVFRPLVLSIRMHHCRIPATDGVEFWIICKRPAFLSSFSPLQLIQNKRPWCWDAAYLTAG